MTDGTDRRSPYGDLLIAHVRDAPGGTVTFDDLARALAGSGARISHVADWLAQACASGVLEHAGFDTGDEGQPVGSRRYRLATGGPPQRRSGG